MTGDEIAQLTYLGLLLAVIGGYFFVGSRKSLGKTAQMAAIWGMIFVGAVAVAGLWNDLGGDARPQQMSSGAGQIEVPVARDGHYYLTLEIDGTPVRFMVDTGASDMVLTERDAERVGIDTERLGYIGQAQTANGAVDTAPVWLDTVRLGEMEDFDVRASVNGGDLDISLLGMRYLELFGKVEIGGGRLVLSR